MKTNQLVLFSLCLLWLSFSFESAAQSDSLQVKAWIKEGRKLYYDGQYEAARIPYGKAFELAQKIYPQEHEVVIDLYFRQGKNERRMRAHPEAIELIQKGIDLAKNKFGEQSDIVGQFHIEFGNIYNQMYRPKEANIHDLKAIEIFKAVHGEENLLVGNAHANYSLNLVKMGRFADAYHHNQIAFDIYQKSSKPNSKEFYRIYNNQGRLFRMMGDYDRALEYGQKALEIKLIHYDTFHPSVAKYYLNIGDAYRKKGAYQKAYSYIKKSLLIHERSLGNKHSYTANSYNDLALIERELGRLDEAIALHKKSIAIYKDNGEVNHPHIPLNYSNIANIYEEKGQYDKALKLYEKANDQLRNRKYVPEQGIAVNLRDISNVYHKKGKTEQAITVINQAINQFIPDFSFEGDLVNLKNQINHIQLKGVFLDLLSQKTRLHHDYYKTNKAYENLEQALIYSKLTIHLIEKMRKGFQSETASQFLNSETSNVFELAVEQAFEAYQITKDQRYLATAFEFAEKNKANTLWQNINAQHALASTNIPSDKIEAIQLLNQQISRMEKTIRNTEKSSPEFQKLTSESFDLKLAYEQLIQDLEKDNPEYYQLKYAPSTVSPGLVQNKLTNKNTLLIDYFYANEHLYIFTFSSDDLKGFKVPIPFELKERILNLRNNKLSNLVVNQNTSENYIADLNNLHELLIQPIEAEVAAAESLVIVPHGVLQLLSFESLAPNTNTNDFRKLDYLLKTHNIQYSWSATLWANRPEKQSKANIDFIGFAPTFDEPNDNNSSLALREGFGVLHFSVPEIMAADHHFPGQTFVDDAASETQFLQMAPKSKIIHLATHAIANDRFPMQSGLLFSKDEKEDGFLNTLEIYNLDLSADLAVMSACNTGYGAITDGEGVMSLGRAFLYAGCKSIVMSLWLANDQSTSSIIQDFYEYSANGFSKNESLKKAKLAYLAKSDPLTAHPYFWANLVAVGDMRPLKSQSNVSWPMVGLGFGFLLLLFGWLKKSNTQRLPKDHEVVV